MQYNKDTRTDNEQQQKRFTGDIAVFQKRFHVWPEIGEPEIDEERDEDQGGDAQAAVQNTSWEAQ